MGYFSWLTADTLESIPVAGCDHPDHPSREVWLLQPNGECAIHEPSYQGYGVFGGIDAYQWLALHNLPPHLLPPASRGEAAAASRMAPNGFMTRVLTRDELRTVGVSLAHSSWIEDPETGRRMTVFHHGPDIIDPTIEHLALTWAQPVPGYDGASANELVAQGRVVKKQFDIAVPLKFSFDPHAIYENLPASQDCEHQGIYYPESGEEDEDPCGECGSEHCDGSCIDERDGEFDDDVDTDSPTR